MLPDKLRENPQVLYLAIAAIILALFGFVWLVLMPADTSRAALYVCDACNNEFKAPAVREGRPTCPKCGAAEGVDPTYFRCPKDECKTLFEGYRTRSVSGGAGGGRYEVKIPGRTGWLPERVVTGGKVANNPDYLDVVNDRNAVCPKCKYTARGDGQALPFKRTEKIID